MRSWWPWRAPVTILVVVLELFYMRELFRPPAWVVIAPPVHAAEPFLGTPLDHLEWMAEYYGSLTWRIPCALINKARHREGSEC